MPGTPDRTTIAAALEALTNRLRDELVAEPPTDTSPFRRVEAGSFGADAFARPFLSLALTHTRTISAVDHDKAIEVGVMLRSVVDVSESDPHTTLLGIIGAVDDFFDGAGDTMVIEGAAGFDDRGWKIDYPRASAGSRVAVASAEMTFVVTVERSFNRVPAG